MAARGKVQVEWRHLRRRLLGVAPVIHLGDQYVAVVVQAKGWKLEVELEERVVRDDQLVAPATSQYNRYTTSTGQTSEWYLLRLARLRINSARAPDAEKGLHVRLHLLYVGEHVNALLRVHARDSVQETALQAQCDGRAGLDDGVACSRDVDALDGFASDFARGGRSRTNRGHQPEEEVSFRIFVTRLRGLPDGRDAILGAGEDCEECQ